MKRIADVATLIDRDLRTTFGRETISSEFYPVYPRPEGDVASRILFSIADDLRLSLEEVCRRCEAGLSEEARSIARVDRGFLNVTGPDTVEWLCSQEETVPFCERPVRTVVAPPGPRVSRTSFTRLLALALVQCVLGARGGAQTSLSVGDVVEEVSGSWGEAARLFSSLLSLPEQSFNPMDIVQGSEIRLTTLWMPPQSIARRSLHEFLRRFSTLPGRPILRMPEPLELTLPESFEDRLRGMGEDELAYFTLLNCGERVGRDLDLYTVHFDERANIGKACEGVASRVDRILGGLQATLREKGPVEVTPEIRRLLVSQKLFGLLVERGAYRGEVFEFGHFLVSSLRLLDRVTSCPERRERIANGRVSDLEVLGMRRISALLSGLVTGTIERPLWHMFRNLEQVPS